MFQENTCQWLIWGQRCELMIGEMTVSCSQQKKNENE